MPDVAHAHDLKAQVQATRGAGRKLAGLTTEQRNRILVDAADSMERRSDEILAANQNDCDLALAAKIAQPLLKRLKTTSAGIAEMAMRVRDVAKLNDPLGHVLATTELDEGLVLEKVPCPLGVVAVIFESRPDAVPQVSSLAMKTGNGLVLKGGVEARHSNRVLVSIWRDALAAHDPALSDSICLLEDRAEVMQVLQMDREIDLVVPRGSTEFVNFVFRNSRIPVLGHGAGICHVYVDRAADLGMATAVVVDSKIQYPAACNAAEKVLVHREIAAAFLPQVVQALQSVHVEVRVDEECRRLCAGADLVPATEEDWSTEYSDLRITIKVVSCLDEAMDHIERYGSRHTEAIITRDSDAAARFMEQVDAASVFHNASTRFADGFRFGLGAEIGISNSKLHARGPVGLEGLLTYKYKLRGSGQLVADYVAGGRRFTHRKGK
ncbi:MAG TPA: glutamate-5-semialdehyde dehydrogenase [Candidatus Angelobacter sp.]|jgi:glutamate-5-semialdehyde dehydrogenase|nr:glutamate-5-semialdehyde dehydrogenase [Candidatus Angelobacter sp.]